MQKKMPYRVYLLFSYHIEEEEKPFIPPPDVSLGDNPENPGYDCVDIYENGGKKPSGEYYVQPVGVKKAFKVFCDNDTLGGGWTLMSKYYMTSGKEENFSDDEPPTDPSKGKDTYFVPKTKKFSKAQVKELR